jgi:regulatory protein
VVGGGGPRGAGGPRAGIGDREEGAALIAAIIARYREAGLLNDAAFAEARARSLFERGQPLRAIRLKLAQKGVGTAEIESALAALAEDEGDGNARALDREAALRLARRRRLGPWRDPARRKDMRERDLAALARAGFSYGIAREVIDGTGEEDD